MGRDFVFHVLAGRHLYDVNVGEQYFIRSPRTTTLPNLSETRRRHRSQHQRQLSYLEQDQNTAYTTLTVVIPVDMGFAPDGSPPPLGGAVAVGPDVALEVEFDT